MSKIAFKPLFAKIPGHYSSENLFYWPDLSKLKWERNRKFIRLKCERDYTV